MTQERKGHGRGGPGRKQARLRWTALVAGSALGLVVASVPAPALASGPGSVPVSAAPGSDGDGLVTVVGERLVYDFDPGVPGDSVTGRWEVRGRSGLPVPWDGVLAVDGQVSPVLARALAVHYGEVDADGALLTWHAAGTLADPVTYAEALSGAPSVDAARSTVIPVRVSLPDPGLVTGEPGETMLVEAAFTVAYLGGAEGAPGGGGPDGDDRVAGAPVGGPLAITGFGSWAAALAAAVLIGLGLLLRRSRRD